MDVTPARVDRERAWVEGRVGRITAVINEVRTLLAERFGVEVEPVTEAQVGAEVAAVFDDGELAVNVAALVGLLRELDVTADYPGFVVDELLGRELAGTLAGNQPLRLLGEATFHFADVHVHGTDEEAAGLDDLDAALAAGFQTRLPGWAWREGPSPFDTPQGEGDGRD